MNRVPATLAVIFCAALIATSCSDSDGDALTPPRQIAVAVIGPEGSTHLGESPIDGDGYWMQYVVEGADDWRDDYQQQLQGTGWTIDGESVNDTGFDASNESGFLNVRIAPDEGGDVVNVCAWSVEPDPDACAEFPTTLSPIPADS